MIPNENFNIKIFENFFRDKVFHRPVLVQLLKTFEEYKILEILGWKDNNIKKFYVVYPTFSNFENCFALNQEQYEEFLSHFPSLYKVSNSFLFEENDIPMIMFSSVPEVENIYQKETFVDNIDWDRDNPVEREKIIFAERSHDLLIPEIKKIIDFLFLTSSKIKLWPEWKDFAKQYTILNREQEEVNDFFFIDLQQCIFNTKGEVVYFSPVYRCSEEESLAALSYALTEKQIKEVFDYWEQKSTEIDTQKVWKHIMEIRRLKLVFSEALHKGF